MKNHLQNPGLETKKTIGEGILGEGAEKYIRDIANIEDLPGDDDDLEIDDDEENDDIETVDYDEDVDDVETEGANKEVKTVDDEEDEDYINKDETKRDRQERGLRP